ncbi:MAG: magnesium chelatase ATPase subunit D, partial [Maricaulaceae bacterium]
MSAPASAVEDASDTATLVWADAGIIAALLAIDPTGLGGVRLRASPSPARTVFLDRVKALLPPGAAWVKAPAQIDTDRLVGGLDLAATLAAGKPVNAKGVLAQADGGVLALAMAERIEPGAAALIAAAMDAQAVRPARGATAEAAPARFAVLALDEGVEDEAPPAALLDRLAFDLDLRMMRWSALDPWPVDPEAVGAARRRFPDVTVPHAVAEAQSQTAAGLQIGSVRGEWLALRVAR